MKILYQTRKKQLFISMKSVKQHNLISRLTLSTIALLFLFTLNLSAQGDAKNGKKLFNSNCAACHKLDKDLVGPALGGITEKRENAWLKAWIKDNAEFQKVDSDAKEAAAYSPTAMNAFPQFSDQEIDDILEYTIPVEEVIVPGGPVQVAAPVKQDNTLLYILGAIMVVMLLMLFNLYRTINELKGDAPKSR